MFLFKKHFWVCVLIAIGLIIMCFIVEPLHKLFTGEYILDVKDYEHED